MPVPDFQSVMLPLLELLADGETRDEAIQNTREAILGYIEAATREGASDRSAAQTPSWWRPRWQRRDAPPRHCSRVVLALLRAEFVLSHIRGSHHYLRRRDGGGLVFSSRAQDRPPRLLLPIGPVQSRGYAVSRDRSCLAHG